MPEAERERDEERARDRERTNSGHPALLIPIRADNKQQSTIRPHTLNPKMVVFLGSLCRDNGLFLPILPSPGLCRHPEIFIAQLLGALRRFVAPRGKPKRARRGSFWCRMQPSIHDSLSSIAERTVPLLLTTCTSSAIQSRTRGTVPDAQPRCRLLSLVDVHEEVAKRRRRVRWDGGAYIKGKDA